MDLPTDDAIADIATAIRNYVDGGQTPSGLSFAIGKRGRDILTGLWMNAEIEADALFGELRAYALTKGWSEAAISKEFAARRWQTAVKQQRAREKAAEPSTRVKPPQGVLTAETLVPQFNGLWMHTRIGGDEAVMDLHSLDLLKRRTFVNMHGAVIAQNGFDRAGNPVYGNAAEIWLGHPDHAIAMAGLVFKPDEKMGLLDVGSPIGQAYNTWTGFGVEPVEGDVSEFRMFMRDGLCAGDETNFNFFWNYHALVVQKPAQPGVVHPILASPLEGIGKGVFGNAMCDMIGRRHSAFISDPDQVTGRFNYTLANKCYVVIDEGIFAGDPKAAAKFRSLITEPHIRLERKYFDSIEVENHVSYISLSNAAHVTHASRSSRRPVVFTPAPWHLKDYAYWATTERWLYGNDKRGLSHLLFALLHTDLSSFEPRNLPITAATIEQRVLSARREPWGFFQDVVARSYAYKSRHGHETVFNRWMEIVSTQLLYLGYVQWADEQKLTTYQRVTYMDFGKFLANDLKLDAKRASSMIVSENGNQGDEGVIRQRAWAYVLGSVEEFEAVLAARMKGDDSTMPATALSPLPDDIPPHDGWLFGDDHEPE